MNIHKLINFYNIATKNKINNGWKKIKIKYSFIFKMIKEKTIFLNNSYSYPERIYCILYNIYKIPICNHENCKNEIHFQKQHGYSYGFLKYCGRNCALTSKNRNKSVSNGLKGNTNHKGKKHSLEVRKRISEKHKGKKLSKETRKKISEAFSGKKHPMYGKHHSEEAKRKIRISTINQIKKQKGQIHPVYNVNSIQYLNWINRTFNLSGQYAENPNEYHIKDLGYFIDFIDFKNKVIIEWDEKKHYDKNNNLRKKDLKRQNIIQNYFSDFKFIRINENKFLSLTIKQRYQYFNKVL
ncbi:hypothetical protein LCGC14_1202250 [marine sediment metagenome]|uniref:Nuclease associated modular domain-containing protein n=1 Tax=marine sediment metagenome TaxID=412755 RepID=A0A0F9NYX5_9ZZZZ